MAAPIVGGMVGGPVGAAAGAMLGNKVGGGSTKDALMAGAMSAGESALAGKFGAKPKPEISTENLNASEGLQKPGLGEGAFGRRMSYLAADPQVAVSEGLNVLGALPQEHPFRKQYTEPLVRTQFMMGGRK